MIIQGVSDVEKMFQIFSDDRIARALYWKENLQIARMVGVRVPKKRLAELDLIVRSRRHLQARLPQRPCSGCILDGLRWYKINSGEPLLIQFDRPSLRDAYDRADECFVDMINTLKSRYPTIQCREIMVGEVPDVIIKAENLDGRNGTLGSTTTYSTRGSDDLDVGADHWVSAEIIFDSSEFWTYGFFFTVGSHELLHLLGLGHAPAGVDDIQAAFYSRDRRDYGVWTHQQLTDRYVGVLPT